MANSYDRRINLYINGTEVKNDIASIRNAMYKLTNEQARMTLGSKEYYAHAEKIKNLKGIMNQHVKDVNNIQTPLQKVIGFAKGLLPAFSFGAIAAGAKMAFDQVVASTDTLSTKWAVFMGGMKSATDEFWRTIATGNWSNFIGNMEKAIEVGRNYQLMMDEIEEKQRALTIIEADYTAEINATEIAVRNKTLSETERIKAAERRIEIEKELAVKRTDIAKAAFESELDVAAQQTKLSKETLMQVASDFDSATKLKAKYYNDLNNELKSLEAKETVRGAQSGVLYPGMTGGMGTNPRIQQIKDEMAATESGVKVYADYLVKIGNSTDDQLNKMSDSYAKMIQAQNSAESNTKKIHTSMYSLIEQTNREIESDNQKSFEKRQKIAAEDEKLAALLGASIEEQQEAYIRYFTEAGEGAWDAFIAAIEKSQKEKTIDFSIVPPLPDEPDSNDPSADYAVEKYRQTLAFKEELLKAQREKNLIGEEEYQDKMAAIQDERLQLSIQTVDDMQQLTSLGTNFVMSLMDLELAKAGENEEKKKEIRKKYANINFAVTVAQIVADTAASIMKGFAQLGPIGGAVSAALLGATGIVQLGIANAQRKQVAGFAAGGYTNGERVYVAGEKGREWIASNNMLNHPVTGPLIATLEEMRSGRLNPDAVKLFAGGGFTNNNSTSNIDTSQLNSFSAAAFRGVMDIEQNKILKQLADEIKALRAWKPKVYIELIKKDLDTLDGIDNKR